MMDILQTHRIWFVKNVIVHVKLVKQLLQNAYHVKDLYPFIQIKIRVLILVLIHTILKFRILFIKRLN